ncbi:MAG: ACT domain-containing protein, partial [Acidimicrobiales bacterium]
GGVGGSKLLWRNPWNNMLLLWAASGRERHARFGEVAFLLEPDLKEGAGGLRDVEAIRAAARIVPEIEERLPVVEAAEVVLRRVRRTLHRRAGRSLDQLLLEEQDGVAAELGLMSADELMAGVAEAARAIAYLGEDTWRRISAPKARGWAAQKPRRLDHGLVLAEGEVAHDPDARLDDPCLPLRAATAAAVNGVTISRQLLLALEAATPVPTVPWPDELREALVDLLATGHAAIPALEALDHHGLVSRLLPEWGAVRHRPQRNAYHRFTVDRHLMETAANAAALVTADRRPDLLLIGALLHDIGKGFPGDHTEVGIEVVGRVAPRMGFGPDEVAVLVSLVRHHLLLAETATRRDLDDPATAAAVAVSVGSTETLDLLAALTEADSLATGPSAWSDWKAGLIRQLVERTRQALLDDAAPPGWHLEQVIHEADGLSPGVHGVAHRCLVVAEDRPGVLSAVAGVMALHGLDVLGARVGSRADGQAVEVLDVEPAFGREPAWEAVAADVEAALDGSLVLADRLAERARQYAPRFRPASARGVETAIMIDNRASERATVIEVRAANGIGVLHRITTAIGGCGLDIRWARVSSHGDEVVDTFYVVDAQTADKLYNPDRLTIVEDRIRSALAIGGDADR